MKQALFYRKKMRRAAWQRVMNRKKPRAGADAG